jgi:predicted nucleic acid-binding protein
LVDANVLIDVATRDPRWLAWSRSALVEAADRGPLAINPIIYAEVGANYETARELEEAFPESEFARLALPFEAAHLAGRTFLAYRRAGGSRPSPLPDFYIGAHAIVSGLRLLTRDARRYRTYFPGLTLIAPTESSP